MNRVLIFRAILIISLACNIAMAWAFVTRPPLMPPHNADEFLSRVTPNMSADDATILRQTFEKYQPVLDNKHKASDEAMDGIRAQLAREPLDPAALAQAIDNAHQARSDYQLVFQKAIEDVAPRLSHSARMQLMPMVGGHHGPPPENRPNGGPPSPPPRE